MRSRLLPGTVKPFAASVLAATLALTACDNNGSSGGSTPPPTLATVSGTTMAGPFLSGTVCAYRIVDGTKGAQIGCDDIDPVTSAYAINVENYTGDVLLEIGNNARYDDEADTTDDATGTLVADGVLRSIVSVTGSGVISSAITPLTEAAIRAAGVLSAAAAQAAAADIRDALGIDDSIDLFNTSPEVTPVTPAQLVYREALRALSQIQFNDAGYADDLGALLDDLADDPAEFADEFVTELNSGLDDDCAVTDGLLTCVEPGTGGGDGDGDGDGGGDDGGGDPVDPSAICGNITCGVGVSPGAFAPALPASIPTVGRLAGTNPSASIASAWANAQSEMKAGIFRSRADSQYANLTVYYYPDNLALTPRYTSTEYDATKVAQTGFTATYNFGADATPLTADDGIIAHAFWYGATYSNHAVFQGPGLDGIWRTADDTTLSGSESLVGVTGTDGNGHRIIVPQLRAGADLAWFTADDSLGSAGYQLVTLNAAGYGVQSVSYNGTGPDNTWFTADDVVQLYVVMELDLNGNALKTVTYDGKGADNTWFTADDRVLTVLAGVVTDLRLTHVASYEDGADNTWFTADDAVAGWTFNRYDANGRITGVATYSSKGADATWLTADDTASAISYLYDAAGRVVQTGTHAAPGADGQWFTGDDTMNHYVLNWYDAVTGKAVMTNAGFTGAGADNTWFTDDDVLSQAVTVRNYNAAGRETRFVAFAAGVGADGKAFTADDVTSYSINRYIDGVQAGGVYVTASNRGADGVAFTADDYGIYNNSTIVDGKLVKLVSYSSPGADAIWFNSDDTRASYIVYTYGANGRQDSSTQYGGAGADGIWETADDVLAGATVVSFTGDTATAVTTDANSQITTWASLVYSGGGLIEYGISYGAAGTDATWQTSDDVVSYTYRNEFDATGRTLSVAYGTLGADLLPNTADDFTTWTRYNYADLDTWGGYITYYATGLDGAWFTSDDVRNVQSIVSYPVAQLK